LNCTPIIGEESDRNNIGKVIRSGGTGSSGPCHRPHPAAPWASAGRREEQMTRTPEEVFAHHAEALGAGDLDKIVADYADDAVFITSSGIMRGKEGVRAAFTQLLSDLPDASWALNTQIFDGDLLFLEWAAES